MFAVPKPGEAPFRCREARVYIVVYAQQNGSTDEQAEGTVVVSTACFTLCFLCCTVNKTESLCNVIVILNVVYHVVHVTSGMGWKHHSNTSRNIVRVNRLNSQRYTAVRNQFLWG